MHSWKIKNKQKIRNLKDLVALKDRELSSLRGLLEVYVRTLKHQTEELEKLRRDSQKSEPWDPENPETWKQLPLVNGCVKNDKRSISTINRTWPEFLEEVAEFTPFILHTTLSGKFKTNSTKRKWPPDFILFFTLVWGTTNMRPAILSSLYKVHERDVPKILCCGLGGMARALRGEIKAPLPADFVVLSDKLENMTPPGMEDCLLALDGTRTEVRHPAKLSEQRKTWDVHHHVDDINTQLIVPIDGSDIYGYSHSWLDRTDQQTFNREELWHITDVSPWVGLLVDKNYTLNSKARISAGGRTVYGFSPPKKPPKKSGRTLTAAEKQQSKWLSQARVVVENVNHVFKRYGVVDTFYGFHSDGKQRIPTELVFDTFVPLTAHT